MFVGRKTLEIATWVAACLFNEGFMAVLKIMDVLGIEIGPHAIAHAEKYNARRIARADKNTSELARKVRASRGAEKVAENDAYEESEGLLYGAGIND